MAHRLSLLRDPPKPMDADVERNPRYVPQQGPWRAVRLFGEVMLTRDPLHEDEGVDLGVWDWEMVDMDDDLTSDGKSTSNDDTFDEKASNDHGTEKDDLPGKDGSMTITTLANLENQLPTMHDTTSVILSLGRVAPKTVTRAISLLGSLPNLENLEVHCTPTTLPAVRIPHTGFPSLQTATVRDLSLEDSQHARLLHNRHVATLLHPIPNRIHLLHLRKIKHFNICSTVVQKALRNIPIPPPDVTSEEMDSYRHDLERMMRWWGRQEGEYAFAVRSIVGVYARAFDFGTARSVWEGRALERQNGVLRGDLEELKRMREMGKGMDDSGWEVVVRRKR